MVGRGEPAPRLVLHDLDDNRVSLSDQRGKTVVLYFFAPWCSVCHASSHNVNVLRQAYPESELAVFAVGLGYETVNELKQFAGKHELSVPVLIGTDETNADYRVSAFPSVYILNGAGEISHRLIGYTTEWGLRLRTALTNRLFDGG